MHDIDIEVFEKVVIAHWTPPRPARTQHDSRHRASSAVTGRESISECRRWIDDSSYAPFSKSLIGRCSFEFQLKGVDIVSEEGSKAGINLSPVSQIFDVFLETIHHYFCYYRRTQHPIVLFGILTTITFSCSLEKVANSQILRGNNNSADRQAFGRVKGVDGISFATDETSSGFI